MTQGSSLSGEDQGYWISIGDLMTGLLIIFILTLTYYMLTYSQKTARLTDNDRVRAEILLTIERYLKDKGILDVQVDVAHGVLRLPEGVLFDSGEAEIKADGLRVIQVLGPVLKDVLGRENYRGRVETVFVEGHTDSVPIRTKEFASNWELSTKRAINAWNELRKETPGLDSLFNDRNEPLFSCSGYAETRPIASNETEKVRQKNRRIDLRFAMSPPRREESLPVVKDLDSQMRQSTP